MPAINPDPRKIKSFRSEQAFEAWLAANHASATELWLKIHKKDSGMPTVSYAQALDVALCWGWIDGIRKAFNTDSFLQRFSPRKARSSRRSTKTTWSTTTASARRSPPTS